MRPLAVALLALASSAGCAMVQGEWTAQEAQTSLLGFDKDQIVSCMGHPANKGTAVSIEVWSYASTDAISSRGGGSAGFARRACLVSLTITGGRVSEVNYLAPTGGAIKEGEQCAFTLPKCSKL